MSTEAVDTNDLQDGGLVATFIFSAACFLMVIPFWLCCRKKFPRVYFSRKLDDPKQKTYFKWVMPTLLTRGKELLLHNGMKAVLYLEWKEMSIGFVTLISAIGMMFISPVYIYLAPRGSTVFDMAAAVSIPPNSNFTWFTFVFCTLIALGFLFLFLVHRVRSVVVTREHLNQGGAYLLVAEVNGIPKDIIDENDIKEFIESKSGVPVYNVSIAWKGKDLFKNQSKLLKNRRKLKGYEKILEETGKRQKFRPGFRKIPGLLLCRFRKIDAINYHEKKVRKLEQKVKKIRNTALEEKEHSGFAFVTFKSFNSRESVVASWNNICSENDPMDAKNWKFKEAKPIDDLCWKNVHASTKTRGLREFLLTFVILLCALFWTIPVAILSNLDTISQIPFIGPSLDQFFVQTLPGSLQALIESTAPALLQLALFQFIPYICLYISKPEKHLYYSDLHASAMVKYWIFIIFNFYIFYLLLSSGLDLVQALLTNPGEIRQAFETLDWALYGSFYCNYLITLALYDAIFTFLRLYALIKSYLFRYLARHGTKEEKEDVFAPYDFKYYVNFAKEAVYFAMIMTFAPIVPFVPLCGLLAYTMNYIADKISIISYCSYDPGIGKKMILLFGGFINFSLILTFLFWIFFFSAHGPSTIAFTAAPTFILLWLVSIGLMFSTKFYASYFLQKYPVGVKDPLLKDSEISKLYEEAANQFSWEYVSDPSRDSHDPLIQELFK